MFLKSKLSFVAVLIAVGLASCADDKKKQEEVAAQTALATPDTPPPAPAAPAAELTVEAIYFGFDEYTLTSDAQSKLTAMAEGMKAAKTATVQIEGHCDERGTVEYNLALGERRAQSVKTFLTQLGVDAGRLSTISYGEEKPVAQGHAEDAWAKNRRAEFVITSK
jgi:peptidoglycan-associated lipoprotein